VYQGVSLYCDFRNMINLDIAPDVTAMCMKYRNIPI